MRLLRRSESRIEHLDGNASTAICKTTCGKNIIIIFRYQHLLKNLSPFHFLLLNFLVEIRHIKVRLRCSFFHLDLPTFGMMGRVGDFYASYPHISRIRCTILKSVIIFPPSSHLVRLLKNGRRYLWYSSPQFVRNL